jgi:ATP-dependent Clp protease ATP-binding subunit ClpA
MFRMTEQQLQLAGMLSLAAIATVMLAIHVTSKALRSRRKRCAEAAAQAQAELSEIQSRLDAMAQALEQRVEQAVARLEQAAAAADEHAAAVEARCSAAVAAAGERAAELEAPRQAAQQAAEQLAASCKQAQQAIEALRAAQQPATKAAIPVGPMVSPDHKLSRHGSEIMRMWRDGADASAIARQFQMTPGEVELVLNLLKPRAGSAR